MSSAADNISKQHFTLLLSAGRTGSTFLGELLSEMIKDGYSTHEPDSLDFKKIKEVWSKVGIFGLNYLFFQKVLGKSGMRAFSNHYLQGSLDKKLIIELVRKRNEKLFKNAEKPLFLESNYGWYGLLPLMNELFEEYKVAIVVRDPRNWVQSNMNWQRMYGKKDWLPQLIKARLTPKMLQDKSNERKWSTYTVFQKLCWAWSAMHQKFLEESLHNPRIKIVKYENLFLSEKRDAYFKEFLQFICEFGDRSFGFDYHPELLHNRLNLSGNYLYPDYQNWEKSDQDFFESMCGELRTKFGYH